MSGVNVQVYVGLDEWPEVETRFPVTLTFAESVQVTLTGNTMLDRAEWLRLTAQRLLDAAEQVEADHEQTQRDLRWARSEVQRLRRGES